MSTAVELSQRKPLRRIAFNTAQVALSLAAGLQLMRLTGASAELWSPAGPGIRWLLAATGVGVVAVLVNGLLTAVVFSLSQQISMWVVVRDTLKADGVMDLLLLALAPVLTGVGVRSFVLLPLLVVVVVGVYQSSKVGLAHRHEATHDLLTGLPNRRFFVEQAALTLDVARARGRTPAVLLIDLDGFKEINDRLGHAVGDLTLREVAVRLLKHRRSTDIVARLGGDEFAILLGGDIDPESAERVATSLLHSLREPLELDGVPVAIDGSVGMAFFPSHGEDLATLLQHADAAMYRAKSAHLGLQTYDDSRDRHGPTRMGLIGELRDALANDELLLVYQPEIDLTTGLVCGVEALVRWQHPTRGLLMPDQFVPAVEQTELVDELTERVLRLAAAQAARWRAEGLDLRVAINTSARNLLQIRFPRLVSDVLEEWSLPASALELEITENTVTNDPVRTETVLGELRRLGVSVAVDDFGTGYSSLVHLRNLPIDRIKIDRSFVRGVLTNRGRPGDRALHHRPGGQPRPRHGGRGRGGRRRARAPARARLPARAGLPHRPSRPARGRGARRGRTSGRGRRALGGVVVILPVAVLVVLATVPLFGGRLSRLADLRARAVWAALAAIVLQFAIIKIADRVLPHVVASGLHLVVSYALAAWFVVANLRIRGLWIVALGGALNVAAIAANDGVMPATPEAARRAGLVVAEGFANSQATADAHLWWLGDAFAIPASWPLSNVFSVGDVILVIGFGVVLHRACGSRLRRRPDAEVPPQPVHHSPN